MFIKKTSLPRRSFLRGMGVTLALPFLDAMVPSMTALAQTAANPVRRFGAVFFPLGTRIDHWKPTSSEAGFAYPEVLKPLEKHRDVINIVSNTYRGPNGAHAGSATWLCGVNIKPTDAEDFFAHESVDQVIAKQIGQTTQFRSIEIATESHALFTGGCGAGFSCAYYNLAWTSPTTPLPMETNPRVLFERLFGGTGTVAERELRQKQNASILDSVQQEVKGLSNTLGQSDRVRLNEYLQNVRDLEQRIQRTEAHNHATVNVAEPDQPAGIPEAYSEHVGLMFDLMAVAYAADMTRVFTFGLGREASQKTFPEINIGEPWHAISHHKRQPAAIAQLLQIELFLTQQFGKFVDKLQATPDGDGSLLDHSVLLYGSGMSDSDTHEPKNLPMAVVGKGAGLIRTADRHLDLKAQPVANLYLDLSNKFGVEMRSFGESNGRIQL